MKSFKLVPQVIPKTQIKNINGHPSGTDRGEIYPRFILQLLLVLAPGASS